MIGESVRVAYTKYDGSLHWHQTAHSLGEDEHGRWLGAAAGFIVRKGETGPEFVIDYPQVLLFPRDGWWTAVFNGAPAELAIYCDITTPPRWPETGLVTMVDLDLDVALLRIDGAVKLLDEDEFAEHRHRYGYPPEVVANAVSAARWLYEAVSELREPFGSTYRRWLDLVSEQGLSTERRSRGAA